MQPYIILSDIEYPIDESKEGEEILSFGTGRPNKDGELLEVKELEKRTGW